MSENKIGQFWEKYYSALKFHDSQIYRMALDSMEAVTLKHRVTTKVAADYEMAAVLLVCDILGIKP